MTGEKVKASEIDRSFEYKSKESLNVLQGKKFLLVGSKVGGSKVGGSYVELVKDMIVGWGEIKRFVFIIGFHNTIGKATSPRESYMPLLYM